jgi:hypothetical protein
VAIAYPRSDIITTGQIVTESFELVPRQQITRRGNGTLITADLADPIWKAAYTTAVMNEDDCLEMQAKLDSLDGSLQLFNANDTRRTYPRNYRTGSFTDAGQVFSLVGDGVSLVLNNLPANFAMRTGDYFRYASGGRRYLHRLMEDNTASAGGVSGTLVVRPFLAAGLTTTTAVFFKSASCRMKIEPGSVQYNSAGRTLGTVSFKGVEAW